MSPATDPEISCESCGVPSLSLILTFCCPTVEPQRKPPTAAWNSLTCSCCSFSLVNPVCCSATVFRSEWERRRSEFNPHPLLLLIEINGCFWLRVCYRTDRNRKTRRSKRRTAAAINLLNSFKQSSGNLFGFQMRGTKSGGLLVELVLMPDGVGGGCILPPRLWGTHLPRLLLCYVPSSSN